MKKILSVTMLALLVAGTASMLVAYSETWSGSAEGDCGVHIKPFQPWIGLLVVDEYPYDDYFAGYCGNDENNELHGSNISTITQGGYTVYQLSNANWNYQGGQGSDPYGTWNCTFVPALDTCDGDWVDSDSTCNYGDLWGTEQ